MLSKKNKAEDIMLLDYRLYYKATVIKQHVTGTKNRHIDQWNRIENPEINPHTYGKLIYDKKGKNIQWRKYHLFNEWCWENWTATCKTMKLEHFAMSYTKINPKWIKDLNVRSESIKLLKENICRTHFDINHSNIVLGMSLKVEEIKAKIN